MKSLAVMNQKGGVGKTTTATHIAVAAMRLALVTLILDLDAQTSATLWSDRREFTREEAEKIAAEAANATTKPAPIKRPQLATNSQPAVMPAQPARLSRFIADARKREVEFLIFDTPPNDAGTAGDVVRHSDAILIPTPPKPLDLAALPTSIAIARASRKPFFVVLTNAPVQGSEAEEAAASFARAGIEVAPFVLHTRKAFYSHMKLGETAEDFDPGGKAAAEARALTLWVCDRLGILHQSVNKSTNIQVDKLTESAG